MFGSRRKKEESRDLAFVGELVEQALREPERADTLLVCAARFLQKMQDEQNEKEPRWRRVVNALPTAIQMLLGILF